MRFALARIRYGKCRKTFSHYFPFSSVSNCMRRVFLSLKREMLKLQTDFYGFSHIGIENGMAKLGVH